MSDRREEKYRESSKSSSSKSSSKSSPKSSPKSKSSSKKDDWSEVNEPDERRRIQNRIAQRKFREKAKDEKEVRERDADNQRRAGYSYSSPDPRDLGGDYDLSGLPWGGPSMRHIVERGQAREKEPSHRGGSSQQNHNSYYYYGNSASGRGSGSGSGGRGSESR